MDTTTQADRRHLISEETWDRIRVAYLAEGRSAVWIAEQPWSPSRPTVIKVINKGIDVRALRGDAVRKPPLLSLKPAAQGALRASKGAARVLAVVEAVASGDKQTAGSIASEVIQAPQNERRKRKALPSGQPHQSTGHPADSSDASGVTPTTVLRELARLDGAATIAEEAAMVRDGKVTAYDVLCLARTMVADGRVLQAKISAAVAKMQIETGMDVLLAVKINSAITLAADRATRVVERVLDLERELLGDPRDATGATGAPGETFAMTEEEALAEARRCAHTLERYGVPFAVGSRAEIPAVVENQQDVQTDAPHVFVPARDDELGDDRTSRAVE